MTKDTAHPPPVPAPRTKKKMRVKGPAPPPPPPPTAPNVEIPAPKPPPPARKSKKNRPPPPVVREKLNSQQSPAKKSAEVNEPFQDDPQKQERKEDDFKEEEEFSTPQNYAKFAELGEEIASECVRDVFREMQQSPEQEKMTAECLESELNAIRDNWITKHEASRFYSNFQSNDIYIFSHSDTLNENLVLQGDWMDMSPQEPKKVFDADLPPKIVDEVLKVVKPERIKVDKVFKEAKTKKVRVKEPQEIICEQEMKINEPENLGVDEVLKEAEVKKIIKSQEMSFDETLRLAQPEKIEVKEPVKLIEDVDLKKAAEPEKIKDEILKEPKPKNVKVEEPQKLIFSEILEEDKIERAKADDVLPQEVIHHEILKVAKPDKIKVGEPARLKETRSFKKTQPEKIKVGDVLKEAKSKIIKVKEHQELIFDEILKMAKPENIILDEILNTAQREKDFSVARNAATHYEIRQTIKSSSPDPLSMETKSKSVSPVIDISLQITPTKSAAPVTPEPIPRLPSSSPPTAPNLDSSSFYKFFTPMQFTPGIKSTTRPINFSPVTKKRDSLSDFLQSTLDDSPPKDFFLTPEKEQMAKYSPIKVKIEEDNLVIEIEDFPPSDEFQLLPFVQEEEEPEVKEQKIELENSPIKIGNSPQNDMLQLSAVPKMSSPIKVNSEMDNSLIETDKSPLKGDNQIAFQEKVSCPILEQKVELENSQKKINGSSPPADLLQPSFVQEIMPKVSSPVQAIKELENSPVKIDNPPSRDEFQLPFFKDQKPKFSTPIKVKNTEKEKVLIEIDQNNLNFSDTEDKEVEEILNKEEANMWGSQEDQNDSQPSQEIISDYEINFLQEAEVEQVKDLQTPLSIAIDQVEDDFFGSIRDDKPFSVAAVSPREVGADSIHQNFSDFTNDMLANDYMLIETQAVKSMRHSKGEEMLTMEKINEEPVAEEEIPWARTKFDESPPYSSAISEEMSSFVVDWSNFCANPTVTLADLEAKEIEEREKLKECQKIEQLNQDLEELSSEKEKLSSENEKLSPREEEMSPEVEEQEEINQEISEQDETSEEVEEQEEIKEQENLSQDHEDKENSPKDDDSWTEEDSSEEIEDDELETGDRVRLEGNEVPEGTFEKTIRIGSDLVNLRLIPNAGHTVEMGSNVSREKGLNRRSVSSGHLDAPLPRASKGHGSHFTNHITSQATNKFCGSLPNYLDIDDDPKNNNMMSKNHHNMDLESILSARISKQEPLLLPPPPLFHDQDTEKSPEEDPEECPTSLLPNYPFITKENLFEVILSKGSRGLGLSVTGGIDCPNEPWPGIIRIKRLFPHQPAWQDGKLAPGDVLLEADGTKLTGLSNYEALEVLRTTLKEVRLKVCRPPAGAGLFSIEPEENDMSVPVAPLRQPKFYKADRSSDESDDEHGSSKPCASGEFEIEITKVEKSLGFTLRKEDDSRLGHYVLALVKEPAVSDGRIKPGDKIVAVNGVDISSLSHKEAVDYLRKCGEVVTFRLYRDAAQTPVSFLDGFRTFPRTKPMLRKEAIDMLSDLAGKKHASPQDVERRRRSSEEPYSTGSLNHPSPRRRKAKTPPSPAENKENKKPSKLLALDLEKHPSGLTLDLTATDGESTSRNSSRPVSLDLSTPSSLRKQKFQFMSPPFSGEDDDDDASVIAGLSPPNEYPGPSSLVSQPASMPPINLEPQFIHRKPEYQSANLSTFQSSSPASSDQDIPGQKMHQGHQGLLKWKGVMFTPDKENVQSKAAAPPTVAKKTPILNLEDREGTVIVVELTRGWNSRLGFTLCADKEGRTLIKDIYPDSVAYKDGRLKPTDHLVMVNDDNIEHLPTDEVIDLVRKIRGTVAITVIRANTQAQ